MRRIFRLIILSLFRRVSGLLSGKAISRLPAVTELCDFLFWHTCPRESIMEIEGSKIYLNTDKLPVRFNRTYKFLTLSGAYEPYTTEIFKRVVKEGDIVVDLGANIGYFTLLASRLVGGEGKVYAFEPELGNYSLLLKNIEINGYNNIIAEQKAVSDKTGTARLFLDKMAPVGHTIYQSGAIEESIEIEMVALDDYFEDEKHPINVIKMDIEGAEIATFLGMERIIRENRNLKIFTEFNPALINQSGYTADEFASRLLEFGGFSAITISDYGVKYKYMCTYMCLMRLFWPHKAVMQ